MTEPKIVRCPPGAARGSQPEVCFPESGKRAPSSVRFGADGEAEGTGISYEDYGRMRTVSRKYGSGERKNPTPDWATNAELALILTHYMERRAGFDKPQTGTLGERIKRAHEKLQAQEPRLTDELTRLCREYVDLKNSGGDVKRIAFLQTMIQNVDTRILCNRRGAAVIGAVISLYYRARLDSVGIAMELGINPPAVRQIIYKMNLIHRRLQGDAPPRKPRQRKVLTPEEAARKLELHRERQRRYSKNYRAKREAKQESRNGC